MLTVSPSDATYSAFNIRKFDAQDLEKKFKEDQVRFLQVFPVRRNDVPFRIVFRGELYTHGIKSGDDGLPDTFGITLNTEEDFRSVEMYPAFLDTLAEEFTINDFSLRGLLRNDVIYFKLKKTKDEKHYDVISDIPLDPKDQGQNHLYRHEEVEVTCEMFVYVNLASRVIGYSLKTLKLKTKLTPPTPAPVKKVKKN